MKNEYNLLDILKVLGKHKRRILYATGLIALVSIVGTLLMPNYYKSTAIFYAASPTLANPDPVGGTERTYFIYGTGDDLDRLFSIANSSQVKNYIIQSFDLYTHYDIDSTSRKGKAKMMKRFNKLYETVKTKYDALELSIEDTDPQLAKEMVAAARLKVEAIAQRLIKESQEKMLSALEAGINSHEINLKTLGDSLTILKKRYDIYDSYAQAEVFAELTTQTNASLDEKEATVSEMIRYNLPKDTINKVRAKIAGLKKKKENLKNRIDNFNSGVLQIRKMESEQNRSITELALDKERYKKLKATFDSDISAIHMVETETIPPEKSRPKRSIYVIGFTLLGFMLSCLFILLMENTRDVDWKSIYDGK